MATITPVGLNIQPSTTDPGQSLATVSYNVIFDSFEMMTNTPYHTHVDLIGDDTNEPLKTGTRVVYGYGTGGICPAMCLPHLNTLIRLSQFNVPNSSLDEDVKTGHRDEIRARVTISTPAAVVFDSATSNMVPLTLG